MEAPPRVVHGRASEGLLDSYHVERHAVAQATLLDTHLATRLTRLKNPIL